MDGREVDGEEGCKADKCPMSAGLARVILNDPQTCGIPHTLGFI